LHCTPGCCATTTTTTTTTTTITTPLQVIELCEKPRDPPLQHIIVDTPGQIEIFTWSASGSIITELFASSFPTVVAYVVDTPRCTNPQTFMSNMLQACSILYKTKLPLLLVRARAHGARQ
jgi:GTPase SAR1 family protein